MKQVIYLDLFSYPEKINKHDQCYDCNQNTLDVSINSVCFAGHMYIQCSGHGEVIVGEGFESLSYSKFAFLAKCKTRNIPRIVRNVEKY